MPNATISFELTQLPDSTVTPTWQRPLKRTRSEGCVHTPTHRPGTKRSRSALVAITKLIVEAPPSSLGRPGRIAPEIRNAIYSLLLQSDKQIRIVADEHAVDAFTFRESSSESQYASMRILRKLSIVSSEVRREARTYFCAANSFTLCCYHYEYLPIFVRWLEAIGNKCKAVLKSVEMYGYQWY
jgi:hypothetical protein